MLYFQIKFSSVFSPWFCFFSSPNWTGLGQDHYSKWEASHNRATKECHHPAIFLGQKWFSGSYLYRDYHLRRTKPGHQQEGRQCACCAVNCLLTKPGRLVSADAPTLPELTHLSNIWCYDLIQQSSHQKKVSNPQQTMSVTLRPIQWISCHVCLPSCYQFLQSTHDTIIKHHGACPKHCFYNLHLVRCSLLSSGQAVHQKLSWVPGKETKY